MSGARPPVSKECRRWDARYAAEPLFFGEEPNPYLVEVVERHVGAAEAPGTGAGSPRALCLGEGEGRDALFLARRGFEVTAVDGSLRGLEKLACRARAAGLAVWTVYADLADFCPPPAAFDLVTSFYCHLPPALRRVVHDRAVRALRPGGYLVLEGFTPRQRELGLSSGGPGDLRLLFEPGDLRRELDRAVTGGALILHCLQEMATRIACGRHRGEARIARFLGQRPA